MGYYSSFIVTVDPAPDWGSELDLTLSNDTGYEGYLGGLESSGKRGEYHNPESWKWYEMQDDMVALSTKFPDHRFTVFQVGEDSEASVYYFKGGKQYWIDLKYEIPPFDESKLK